MMKTKYLLEKTYRNFENYGNSLRKSKKNETKEEALIREMKEEININLSMNCIASLTYNSKHINIIILLFVSRQWSWCQLSISYRIKMG